MVFKIETDFWINFNRFYNFKSNDIVILGIVTKFLYWLCFTPDLQSLLKVIFLSRDFQFFQYSCLCITDFENALQFISLRRCLLCLDFSKFWDYKYYFIIISSIIFISNINHCQFGFFRPCLICFKENVCRVFALRFMDCQTLLE